MGGRAIRLVAVGGAGVGIRLDVDRPAAAGETVLARSATAINGGKASNQAIGAAFLGAESAIVSAVGRDEFAPLAREPLVRHGVDTRGLVELPDESTMVGTVMVDAQGENSITLAPGALARLTPAHVQQHERLFREADVCIVSLEIAVEAALEGLRLARTHGSITILNPAPAPPTDAVPTLVALADWVTPNEHEAAAMSGELGGPEEQARHLLALGARGVVVTLGSAGALIMTGSSMRRVPAVALAPTELVDTAGAGDAFNAAFAAALASGDRVVDAVRIGCDAGARICRGRGFVEALDQLKGLKARVRWNGSP